MTLKRTKNELSIVQGRKIYSKKNGRKCFGFLGISTHRPFDKIFGDIECDIFFLSRVRALI
jgi:hypothetical protein